MGNRRVFVVGAGISGLATAYELLKRGEEVCVLERLEEPGGLARNVYLRNFYLDLGPHIYHTSDSDTIQYWERELGNCFKHKHFWSKNYHHGTVYPYPLSAEVLDMLPPALAAQVRDELANKNGDLLKTARNYKEYITGLVGPTLQQMFYEEYPCKLWGIPTSEMDANWAPKRIEFRDKNLAFYYDQWCAVGRRGVGTVSRSLAERIKRLGGELLLGANIESIFLNGDRVQELRIKGGTAVQLSPNDLCISTLSATRFTELSGLKTGLAYRGVVLVYVFVKRPLVLPEKADWLYVTDKGILFTRVSEQKKYSAEDLPLDETCLCFEVPVDALQPFRYQSKEQLKELVVKQFHEMGYIDRSEVLDVAVEVAEEVYPLYRHGYRRELADYQSQTAQLRNLHVIGSLAEFAYADSQILFCKGRDLAALLTETQHRQNRNLKSIAANPDKIVTIGSRTVGHGSPTYIIAEIGLNHNGSFEMAKELVYQAYMAGCDAVKLQTYHEESRSTEGVWDARYREKTLGVEESPAEMFHKYRLPNEQERELFTYARSLGLEIFSTPFDERSAEFLNSLDVSCYKVASFDLTNLPLLKTLANYGRPMILSTGGAYLSDVEDAVQTILETGNSQIVLLHCTSSYPASPTDANLRAIDTLRQAFGTPVGLSDHVQGTLISIAAVVLGADMIERHFTLDKSLEGPDHVLSLTPHEMKVFVEEARLLQKALGTGRKLPRGGEFSVVNAQRKSLFASQDIPEGHLITRQDVMIRAPGIGIRPKYLDLVIGRQARTFIRRGTPISWSDV